ncbi:MAG: HD domain-containing protein [Nitrosopumilaceae archaeon]|nr:HD domain-containing protein [Nitrosopumilaceae archaeon]NIU00730.1 HD domain-containing protein [Nitrosopumilaceae archaeon]NIU87162.1 HD domain-containing protein [Nitrosopumilaceae archaeon]NIV65689.1 HD domain-containing protein [Nitrosopumilaceae archaeon]NIX61332.1 HD domain-containing protein [Nitrosopumilaceae archaeon]
MIQNDPAHDFQHVMRVYKNAEFLCENESVDKTLVLMAVLLHDIVSLPKSDKRSTESADKSAQKAKLILKNYSLTDSEVNIVIDAIKNHSFSKGKTPNSIEGKILQDADRLDALGSIGIARAFSVGGNEKRKLYNPKDPLCTSRNPDDKKWTLDHFYKKLLILDSLMNTKTGKKEAKRRIRFMKNFLTELYREV